jgi:hypothetical protein
MKSLSIPEGVTVIEQDAFDRCTGLTEISIPASVIRIGEDVNDAEDSFDGCTALTVITVAEANEVYTSEDGVLFNKDKTALLLCPEGRSGAYTVPSSVTDIVYCAFEDCAKLTDVTIPGSVTSIGELAFTRSGLTSITIPGSVKVITGVIRNEGVYGVFAACTALTSVTLSEGVTSIGDTAFFGCTKLASVIIPDSVTSIGEQAFALCSGLASITIPASVTSIGQQAFSHSGLTSVIIPEGVTSIDRHAFSECAGLTSVTIPDSATYIGPNAFSRCTALVSVTVSPVNGRRWDDLGAGAVAFYGCSRLSAESRDALRRAGDRSF